MESMNRYIRFGRYLVEKGPVDALDVLRARLLQRKNNRKMGSLLREKAG